MENIEEMIPFRSAESVFARLSKRNQSFKLPKIVRRSSIISRVSRYSETARRSTEVTEEERVEVDVDQWVMREEVTRPRRKSTDAFEDEKKDTIDVGVETSRVLQVFEAGLKMDLSDRSLPDLTDMTTEEAHEILAPVLGIMDMDSNLCSFWILDTLTYVLKKCQSESALPENQKMILTWVLFILKSVAISPEPREKMFDDIIRMFIEIDLSIHPGSPLPSPQLILEKVRERKWEKKMEKFERISQMGSIDVESLDVSFDSSGDSVSVLLESIVLAVSDPSGTISTQSGRLKMYDLILLINIVYELFANRFMYEVVRETFSNPPDIIPITIIQDIPIPKPVIQDPGMYNITSSEIGSERMKRKKDTSKMSKRVDTSIKAKVLAILANTEKDIKKEARRIKTKDCNILTLREAADEKFMNKVNETKKDMPEVKVQFIRSKRK